VVSRKDAQLAGDFDRPALEAAPAAVAVGGAGELFELVATSLARIFIDRHRRALSIDRVVQRLHNRSTAPDEEYRRRV